MKQTMKVIDRRIRHEQNQNPTEPMNAAKMADRMKIDPSLFSRWRTGSQTGVNPETLTSMLLGFSDKDEDRAELLAAFLEDQKHGPGSQFVEISVTSAATRSAESAPDYGTDDFAKLSQCARRGQIDKRTVDALCEIIEAMKTNQNLRRVLLSLAKMS